MSDQQALRRIPSKTQALITLKARGVPVATVIDVGIERGTPELIEIFGDLEHILFEPVQEFAGPIAHAYRAVRYLLIDKAVSDRTGEAVIEVSAITGGEVTHSGLVDATSAGPGRRTVKVTRLDDALKPLNLAAPYLLKVDIDGKELRVLAGATETLAKCSVVIVEVAVYEFGERLVVMERAGFTLFDLVEPCYYDGALWQCDAIFIRSDLQREHFQNLHDGYEEEKYQMFKG